MPWTSTALNPGEVCQDRMEELPGRSIKDLAGRMKVGVLRNTQQKDKPLKMSTRVDGERTKTCLQEL